MSWLPMESVHPLLVHFPIGLLLTALGVDLLALTLRRPALHRVALWNLALGTLGAAAAVWSGYQAAEIAKHTFEIHQVMELHRKLGLATLVLGGVLVAWRLWKRDRLSFRVRTMMLALMVAMAGTLGYGAHLGGRLVYEFGVGGSFGQSPQSKAPHPHDSHEH
jgi:uncharacterized membrane protein